MHYVKKYYAIDKGIYENHKRPFVHGVTLFAITAMPWINLQMHVCDVTLGV